MNQHSSLSVWIEVARSILHDAGFDAEEVLVSKGIDVEKLSDASVDRYGVEEIGEVWREVVRLTGEPTIGLQAVDQYFQPASWQALGLSVLCSNSLHDAFNRLVRYGEIITDVARFAVVESREGIDLQVLMHEDPHTIGDEAADFGFAALLKLFRMIYPGKLAPLSMKLRRAAIDEQAYRDYFGCDIEFSSSILSFRFSPEVVHRQLPMGNAELAAYQDRLSDDYKTRFGNDSLAIKVKDEMMRLLPGGEPTPQAVASSLYLSVRNLQRKLNNEGTSFSALLTEIRKKLAEEYLLQPYRTCNEVAYLLGFSDHSNFTRAFRRWFDTTPTNFRKERLNSM